MSELDKIKVAKDKPFSLDSIKVAKDKPFSVDDIPVATDEDMQQGVDNKIQTMQPTSSPLQFELSLPEQVFQQHLKGQGYPDPKARGILQTIQEWGKKGIETPLQSKLGFSLDANPFTGREVQFKQPARVAKVAQLGDKLINLSLMTERIPATVLMLVKNKREGKPNINNISTKEALINSIKGDPTLPYGDTSLLVAGARTVKTEEEWTDLETKYQQASPSGKFFMDASALLGHIVYGTLTAGKLMIPAMKYLSPSSKIGRVASKSVENAKQMILEDEGLAKVSLDRRTKVRGFEVAVDQIQKDKINIDALAGTADALREQKKTLTSQKTAGQQLRSVNKVIKGAKPELFDKINQLSKDIDALHSEVLSDHRLVKGAMDDMLKSGVRSTGAEQEGIDQVNKAYQILSEDINKSAKDITSLQSAQKRIDNINKMIALSDNMEGQIADQVKRQLYSTGLRGMIQATHTDEYSGLKMVTGILKEKRLNDMAKVISHNRTDDWKKLNGVEMESVYDMFKGLQQIDKDMGGARRFVSWISPERITFEKLGAPFLHSDIENNVFRYTQFMRTVDRTFGEFIGKFKSITGQRWRHGSPEDDLLSYMLDSPNRIPEIYNQPEVAGMLSDAQKVAVQLGANEWRKVTEFLKEEALKEGMMSEDIAGFNALKGRKQILEDDIKVMRAGKSNLKPKTEEYILATAKISEASKELKKVNRAIRIHPPLVVANYYSHKGMLSKNIMDDIEQMRVAKETGWSFDSLPPYAKNSFAGIAVNINNPEFMKRLKNGDLFRRDAMAVMREAVSSEARKIFLQPVFEKGKAYVDALPDGERKQLLHETYEGLVKVTRGMEHPADKSLNKVAYTVSKGIEKTVQSVTGGRLHYVAQRRAFEHFTESLRQLAFGKTLLGNTWNVTKNAFQIAQSVATIGARATLAGVEGVFSPHGLWLLEQMPTFTGSLHPIENFVEPKGLLGLATNIGYIGQTVTEKYWNRAGAGLGGIYHAVTKSQKNMDDLVRFALTHNIDPKSIKGNNFWTVFRRYVEAGNGKDIMRGANDNIVFTQYDYAKYSTPPLLHSAGGRLAFMFSNWSSHYFFSFLPQIWRQLIKGTSTLDVAGVKYKWADADRYGIFKYILATAGTYAIGKGLGFDMGWQLPQQQVPTGNLVGTPVPVTISPPVGLIMDIGTTVIDSMLGKEQGTASAWGRVINDVYPNAIKHGVDVITEKQPPQSLIMKVSEDTSPSRAITRPSRSGRKERISR